MPPEVRAAREADLARRRHERTVRREQDVTRAIAELAVELGATGELTHEAVAARTAVPVGYLRWAYPDLTTHRGDDLSVAS